MNFRKHREDPWRSVAKKILVRRAMLRAGSRSGWGEVRSRLARCLHQPPGPLGIHRVPGHAVDLEARAHDRPIGHSEDLRDLLGANARLSLGSQSRFTPKGMLISCRSSPTTDDMAAVISGPTCSWYGRSDSLQNITPSTPAS